MDPKAAAQEIRRIERSVRELRQEVMEEAQAWLAAAAPAEVRESWRAPLRNLAMYLALRSRDLAPLQERLSHYGLSSLGRSEARVEPSLDALSATLSRLAGRTLQRYPSLNAATQVRRGLEQEKDLLFGPDPAGPATRVMVTLADDAGSRPCHVARLIERGADLFRINCAHGDRESWASSIAAVRQAGRALGRNCRILLDLAGPKIRIAQVSAAAERLHPGARFRLTAHPERLAAARTPTALVSHAEALDGAARGDAVWFDDGKLKAEVAAASGGELDLVVRKAKAKGVRLKAGKGLAFPGRRIDLPALTAKDLSDLDVAARQADLIGFSFVRSPADVAWLQRELASRRPGEPPLPIVLKIETAAAAAELPGLIVQAASQAPTAVMIARGDLALDVGFDQLSSLQEQVLWLCEAAAVPVIWATQVLESLVKTGTPTRGEATDAAMAQRADCVMLNKGPHQVEAVAFLDQVLRGMDLHLAKKSPIMGSLSLWAPREAPSFDA